MKDLGFQGLQWSQLNNYSLDQKNPVEIELFVTGKIQLFKDQWSTFHNNSSEKAPFEVLCAQWFYDSRERQTDRQTYNQQWGRKTRKNSQWEIPNTDLLSKLRKYMYIIFECTQQLIFMCRLPRFPQIRAFCHYYPCGGVFFLFFFPPSDSRRFLLHSISTPNPTSPPKNYNRIQQFWVFVPFVKDMMEQEQFPSDQLIPIIFFLFLFFCFELHKYMSKREKEHPHKRKAPTACTQPRHSAEIPTYLMNEQAMHLMNFSSSHTVRLKF